MFAFAEQSGMAAPGAGFRFARFARPVPGVVRSQLTRSAHGAARLSRFCAAYTSLGAEQQAPPAAFSWASRFVWHHARKLRHSLRRVFMVPSSIRDHDGSFSGICIRPRVRPSKPRCPRQAARSVRLHRQRVTGFGPGILHSRRTGRAGRPGQAERSRLLVAPVPAAGNGDVAAMPAPVTTVPVSGPVAFTRNPSQ